MRLVGLLEMHRQKEKYRSLFKRAMVLARRMRDERDEARREVFVLENSDALEVVALESRVRMLEQALAEVSDEKERFYQESRDSARTAGQLIRLVHDNGWMTEEEILALPNEAPRLAAAAGRPRRYRRKQAAPTDELCTDKNGFHDGHDWTPDPCEPYRWCPGYPLPSAPTIRTALGDGWSHLLNDDATPSAAASGTGTDGGEQP